MQKGVDDFMWGLNHKGMKTRPWPIIILAVIQFLMPLFSIITNAFLVKVSPLMYFNALIEVKAGWELIEFFALFPIAGISIFLMKKWSYPVFLAVMGWTLFSNIAIYMRDYQGVMSPWVIVGFTLINVLFVSYYLLPAVRQIYFNRQLRWWESQPRFVIDFSATVETGGQTEPCTLRDISEGGAFIETTRKLTTGDTITLKMPLFGVELPVEGTVVHTGNAGFGIRFTTNAQTCTTLRRLLGVFRAMGFELRHAPEPQLASFLTWLRGAFSGKGLLPETK